MLAAGLSPPPLVSPSAASQPRFFPASGAPGTALWLFLGASVGAAGGRAPTCEVKVGGSAAEGAAQMAAHRTLQGSASACTALRIVRAERVEDAQVVRRAAAEDPGGRFLSQTGRM